MQRFRLILCFVAIVCLGACSQSSITISSLLDEMVNREALAKYPDPPFVLKHSSSYDRATTKPGEPSWFANWDRSMFIREEQNSNRTEYVMLS